MTSRDGDAPDASRRPVSPDEPLPPELNPRGRRAGRREAKAAAAAYPAPARRTRSARRAAQGGRRGLRGDVLVGTLWGSRVLAALVAAAILVGAGWAWWTWRGFNSDLKRVAVIGTGTGPAGAGKPKQDIDGKDQNILIVGNDDRDSATDAELAQLGTTRDGGSYNTDTMMMLHVPANGSKAQVISFPRDSYVAIPGHGMAKLNSAYVDGMNDHNGDKAAGGALLIQTIQNLTGLTIDHFVQVDLLGFYRISNAIGGVQVNLCAPAKEPNSGIDLPAGVSTIKGTQALAFVRQRYGFPDGLGDLDRIKRQQYFLSAVFRKLSSAGVLLNPIKLQNLLKAVSQSLQVDETLDPLKLAEQMQSLTAGNLSFSTIPTDGFDDNTPVGSVVVVHPNDVKAYVTRLVNPAPATTPAPPAKNGAAPATITVNVVNAAAADGVATSNAAALQKLGFKIGPTSTAASPVSTTVVQYPAGMAAQAAAVAAHVPGAKTVQQAGITAVTLVLGTDGVSVPTTSAPTSTSTPTAPAAGTTTTPPVRTAAQTGCIY